MPRVARFLPPDNSYHIMCRGNNKNIIFRDEDDFGFYLSLFKRFKKEHPFDLYHYCLMPSHIHLLIKIYTETNFSKFMKRLNLGYFAYFRSRYGWVGHFWQDRFKSQLISSDEYLIQCGKYIELNPMRKKMVLRSEDYRWSSFRSYALGEPNDLTVPNIFYNDLGHNRETRQKAYRDLVVSEILNLENENSVLGNDKKFIYNANRRRKYHKKHPGATYRKSPYRKSPD